jgi:uncharacterized protein
MSTTPVEAIEPRPPSAPAAAIPRSERSLAPDIARGAMLLFIALANVGMLLWGRATDAAGHITDSSVPDRIVHFLVQLLALERSRPMFAILYGFGIGIMAARLGIRGLDARAVRRVLRRRGLWLVALGVAHALLLFFGDILSAYGVTGLLALAFVHLPDERLRRWLRRSAAFVVVVFTPLFAGMEAGVVTIGEVAPGQPLAGYTYLDHVLFGGMAAGGSMLLTALLVPYLPLVLGGLLLQRAGWLQHPAEHRPALRRGFRAGMLVNVASSLPVALIAAGVWHPGPVLAVTAAWLTAVGGMVAGFGYICGFALLALRWSERGRRGLPGALAALGARSLSGYLGQSLVMVPLLAPWGLALGDGLGYLGAYGVAVTAWAVTLAAAVAMDRAGMRGPFEVLLRRLVYRRLPAPASLRDVPAGQAGVLASST